MYDNNQNSAVMARPKSVRPTAELQWRLPVDLIDWMRDSALTDRREPGQWLTLLLERERDRPAVVEPPPRPSTVPTDAVRPARPLGRPAPMVSPIPKGVK